MKSKHRPARTTTRTVLSLSAFAILITGGLLYAGPLDPPAAPVTSTYKTLTEVEPRIAINATNTPGDADSVYKITQRGSYYLTGNITGVAGKHGIEIAASGVTLDLMGFDLVGVPAMGAFDGVSVTAANLTNIAVVNGSVRNWGDKGVDLASADAINCRMEGVLAVGNAGTGIAAGHGTTVTNCSTYNNTGNGISVFIGCTVSNCTAYDNNGSGVSTNIGCTVTNCSAYQNAAQGFSIGVSNTVTNCTAYSNSGSGISTSSSCTVADCTFRSNTLDGIVCGSSCIIRGNACSFSGNGASDGAGIHTTGGDNRIEGNNCTGADRGILVDQSGNIIIRNTCATNTVDWDIFDNNVVGPIIDRRAPASSPIFGFSYAGSLGTADANANFTY